MGLTNLRGRMIAFAALGTTALVIVVAVLTQLLAGRSSDADAAAIARARADGVASDVRVGNGRLQIVEGPDDLLDATAWVFDRSGNLIEGDVPKSTRGWVNHLTRDDHERYVTRGSRLFYVRPLDVDGVRGTVIATVDLRPFEASERRLLEAVLVLGALTIGVAAAIADMVTRRSLAVVRQMSEQAEQWQEHDLERRFGLGPAHDEITELGRTLDHMLDRIRDALASERRITDEIAHELRTPLAGLRAEAQWGRSRASGEAAESLDAVLAAVDRMDAALSTVLDAARARTIEPSSCDAAEVVAAMLTHDEDFRGSPGKVRASASVVQSVVAPLLENARAHQVSRTWVTMDAGPDSVVVHVHVHDDGSGFSDPIAAFSPGWSTTGGHGLGLAVVRRLADSHGIRVTAHPGPGGHVQVTLPRA
ncbi:MAG: sensor histidine kinase [Aeromicrobium sp.]